MLKIMLVELVYGFKSNQGFPNYSENAVSPGSPSSTAFWSCLFIVSRWPTGIVLGVLLKDA